MNFKYFIDRGKTPKSYIELFGYYEIHILPDSVNSDKNCETTSGMIKCNRSPDLPTLLHELFHIFDFHWGQRPHDLDSFRTAGGEWVDSVNGVWSRTMYGFKCDTIRCLEHPPSMGYEIDGMWTNDQTNGMAKVEQWADMGLNWVLDDEIHGFTGDPYGEARRKYMEQQLDWIFK